MKWRQLTINVNDHRNIIQALREVGLSIVNYCILHYVPEYFNLLISLHFFLRHNLRSKISQVKVTGKQKAIPQIGWLTTRLAML